MPNKKLSSKDQELKDFIKAGGRKGAEANFNAILKKAVKPVKKKPETKPKS